MANEQWQLSTDVKQVNVSLGTESSHTNYNDIQAVNVSMKDQNGNITSQWVWGHPYTFSWEYSDKCNYTSSTSTIPTSKLVFSNALYKFSTTSPYMHQTKPTSLVVDPKYFTIYYGDSIYWTTTTWDTSLLNSCIKGFTVAKNSDSTGTIAPNSLTATKGKGAITFTPVIYDDVSFIKCSFPSSSVDYRNWFNIVKITYYEYNSLAIGTGSTNTYSQVKKTFNVNASTEEYIATNNKYESTYRNIDTLWYTNSNYRIGYYDDDGEVYPLWTTFSATNYAQFSSTAHSITQLPAFKSFTRVGTGITLLPKTYESGYNTPTWTNVNPEYTLWYNSTSEKLKVESRISYYFQQSLWAPRGYTFRLKFCNILTTTINLNTLTESSLIKSPFVYYSTSKLERGNINIQDTLSNVLEISNISSSYMNDSFAIKYVVVCQVNDETGWRDDYIVTEGYRLMGSYYTYISS